MSESSDFYSGSWIPGPALPWNEARTAAHIFEPNVLEVTLPVALCGAGPTTDEERRSLVLGRPDYAPWKAECRICFERLRAIVRTAANTPRV